MKKGSKITPAQRAKMVAGIRRYHRERKSKAKANGHAITDAMPNFEATVKQRVRAVVQREVAAVLDEMLGKTHA